MAPSTNKLAFMAVVVLLLQASRCAVAQAPAVMVLTGTINGEHTCDGKSHGDGELFVALTTGWFANGKLCQKHINITNSPPNGKSTVAEVVDCCRTSMGCKDDMIGTSKAVWDALGLDTAIREVPVTSASVDTAIGQGSGLV